MMGGHHAASGAAAWVALTAPAPLALAWYPVAPAAVVVGSLVTAGAALLPDLDHRHATIAQSLPPVTTVMARFVEAVSGGHRKGTHSLLGVAAATMLALWLGLFTVDVDGLGHVAVGAGLLSVLLTGLALKALKLGGSPTANWLVAVALGVFVGLNAPDNQAWLPVAVGLGTAIHLVGDLLTTGGIMPTWPLRLPRPRLFRRVPVLRKIWKANGAVALPILGNAGSRREWALLVPVSLYALAGVLVGAYGWLTG